MGKAFRLSLRRQLPLPGLIDSAGTNTTGISACASMDFPLAVASDCPNMHGSMLIAVLLEHLFFQS